MISADEDTTQLGLSGMAISSVLLRIRAAADLRIKPGILQTALTDWAKQSQTIADERNAIVHARWLNLSLTIKKAAHGKLTLNWTERTVEDLKDLARSIWKQHFEGRELTIDLATAGFRTVHYVESTGTRVQPHTDTYPVPGDVMNGRPDIEWPGEKV